MEVECGIEQEQREIPMPLSQTVVMLPYLVLL
jgi:hypothetical protein